MPMSSLRPSDPEQIGPYRLNGRLGTGGMGVVYLAFGPDGESVALKLLHPHLLDEPEYRSRFAGEIAAARAVDDPLVVRLVAAQTTGDQPWMATEYVEGPTLLQAVQANGPLPEARLRTFGADLAAALRALHGVGLVHRDLKPANIVMAWDGPKLIDLGIAKHDEGQSLTQTGVAIGSLLWLSPEVLDGRPATRASDVFGWGLCVAFAGTGRLAFGSGPTASVAYRMTHSAPDLDGVPAGLRGPLGAALAPEPAGRPAAADLEQALGGQPAHPAPSPTAVHPAPTAALERDAQPVPAARRRRRVLSLAGAAVALLVIAGGATAVLASRSSTGDSDRRAVPAPAVTSSAARVAAAPSAARSTRVVAPTTYVTLPAASLPATAVTFADAEQVVLNAGYTPHSDASAYWDPAAPVNAIVGRATNSADGKNNWPFFFAAGRYLGHDSINASNGVIIAGRSADTITLSYAMYAGNDPLCCPSSRQTVRYHWNGSRLEPLDPIPPTDGDYHR